MFYVTLILAIAVVGYVSCIVFFCLLTLLIVIIVVICGPSGAKSRLLSRSGLDLQRTSTPDRASSFQLSAASRSAKHG